MLHEAEMLEGMDVVERQGHRLLQDEEPWPASWCVPPRQQGRLRHTEKQSTDCKEEVSGCVKGGRWKVLAPRLSRHTPELGNSTCHGQLFVPFYSQWKRVRPVLQHSRQHSHQSPRASSISICLHKCSNPIHRQLCPATPEKQNASLCRSLVCALPWIHPSKEWRPGHSSIWVSLCSLALIPFNNPQNLNYS